MATPTCKTIVASRDPVDQAHQIVKANAECIWFAGNHKYHTNTHWYRDTWAGMFCLEYEIHILHKSGLGII